MTTYYVPAVCAQHENSGTTFYANVYEVVAVDAIAATHEVYEATQADVLPAEATEGDAIAAANRKLDTKYAGADRRRWI